MHNLLWEMGKNIVYQECAKECGKHKRLLLFEDNNNILTKKWQDVILKTWAHSLFYYSIENGFSNLTFCNPLILYVQDYEQKQFKA